MPINSNFLLAIDPGNEFSGYVIVDKYTYKPIDFGKINNYDMKGKIRLADCISVIEMIGHYGTGMAAGKTVYETCLWIGRFIETICDCNMPEPELIKRATVKAHICGQSKAKDGNVIQALKDRFGDKGTKANPGFFFGFSKDAWQAFALAVYWIDTNKDTKEGQVTVK